VQAAAAAAAAAGGRQAGRMSAVQVQGQQKCDQQEAGAAVALPVHVVIVCSCPADTCCCIFFAACAYWSKLALLHQCKHACCEHSCCACAACTAAGTATSRCLALALLLMMLTVAMLHRCGCLCCYCLSPAAAQLPVAAEMASLKALLLHGFRQQG
jgi:hypothetical protein